MSASASLKLTLEYSTRIVTVPRGSCVSSFSSARERSFRRRVGPPLRCRSWSCPSVGARLRLGGLGFGGDLLQLPVLQPLAQHLLVELADARPRDGVDEGERLGNPPLGDTVG